MKTILMLICVGVMFAACGNGSGEKPTTENSTQDYIVTGYIKHGNGDIYVDTIYIKK